MNVFENFRIPVGSWAIAAVNWATANLRPLFNFIKTVLSSAYESLESLLLAPPAIVLIAIFAILTFLVKGWRLSLGTVIGLVVVVGVDQWDNAMRSLAMVLVAALIALVIGIPLGVAASQNMRVSAVVRPVLDFLQTMPAFVYLIPTVVIFLAGPVPGLIATVLFAIAPGVRFTELGIRQVDREVIEAGHAFGSSPWRILRQIQLPLALPTIMAGINQVIMLSLSMVVIAGMVGAAGLGSVVYGALSSVNIPLGFEGGLSVVILAIILDRTTAALSDRTPVARALAVDTD